LLETVEWLRPAHQIALDLATAELPEQFELTIGFHTFRCDAHAQVAGELDDGLDDRAAVGVGLEVRDEGLVDLELVEVVAAQIAQLREARSEIVERDA
jgi:hypothetical protein